MKFEEFTAMLVDNLKVMLLKNDNEADIMTEKILKNNGITLTALNIRSSSENICPTIYLEPYYREFENGRSIEEIASLIMDVRMTCTVRNDVTLSKVLDESDVENNIILRIVNREKNRAFLENVPYIEFKDMAITFRRVIEVNDSGLSSSCITNSDMVRWGLDLDTMYRIALVNSERIFPPVIKDIFELLKGDCTCPFSDLEERPADVDELYVMTNEYDINGASVILYNGVLQKCADMVNDDIYILPCSVHEMLFIRAHCSFDEDYLKNLVKEANKTAVTPMDFLSDSIYFYTKDSGELRAIPA